MTNLIEIVERTLLLPRVSILMDKLKEFDEETYRHSIKVAYLAAITIPYLCHDMGDEELFHMIEGALLHDIGKLSVPKNILHNPGRLSKKELAFIRQHPLNGIKYLEGEVFPKTVYDIVLCHHEKLDGSGYPCAYNGDELSEEVKIVTIADMYSAITEKRCYKEAFHKNKAVDILLKDAPDKIDAKILDALLMAISDQSGELEDAFL